MSYFEYTLYPSFDALLFPFIRSLFSVEKMDARVNRISERLLGEFEHGPLAPSKKEKNRKENR